MVEMGESLELRMQWVGDMVSAPAVVNQFFLQAGPTTLSGDVDAHHLTVGYVTPPILSPDMSPEVMEHMVTQPMPVVASGRFVFTPERLRDLHTIIGNHLKQHGVIEP